MPSLGVSAQPINRCARSSLAQPLVPPVSVAHPWLSNALIAASWPVLGSALNAATQCLPAFSCSPAPSHGLSSSPASDSSPELFFSWHFSATAFAVAAFRHPRQHRSTASTAGECKGHLLAKAWTKLCDKVGFYEMPNKVGNNLAADGSRDNLIKIEGLDTYSFEDDDAAWGATPEHPNPTPEEARKAKAHAARNAWVFVDKILEPGDDSDSDSEVDFIQRSELSDSDSESDKSGAEGE